jgi:hypothetical protein
MHDPFPAPRGLIQASKSFCAFLELQTLPLHVHEVLFAYTFYSVIDSVLAPALSTLLVPRIYKALDRRTTLNWNVRVVSLVQSLLILGLAAWAVVGEPGRGRSGWKSRIWGYSGAGGLVQAFAAGYFLWDLKVSVVHFKVLGPGSLVHAVVALAVTLLGFRPFANYYGINLVFMELSTPFLNLHWFFDKLGMTGSTAQLVNGILLIMTFGASRLNWGLYQNICLWKDIMRALRHKESIITKLELPYVAGGMILNSHLPVWLAYLYVGGTTVLTLLNFYWFWQMVKAVRKRFKPAEDKKDKVEKKKD